MVSKFEAELLGMHVGDGTLYRVNSTLVWELRGDLKEYGYYHLHVLPLLKKIFKRDFILKYRSGGKNGCIGVQTCDKRLTSFLLENEMPIGKKSHIIWIPEVILQSSVSSKYFLRGLFDTDGCLRFDKVDYPRIEIGSSSLKLINDVSLLLTTFDLRFHQWVDRRTQTYRICVNGVKMIKKWMKLVGSSNTKHLNKYLLIFKN
ncbi:MAG TPA: LAGLIDADG family homing endonuclease [Candidatus Nanoarchaeia archaeon]|nr:LAGLIDADG family homing endonuclease [Candidatus Nanoarchaeia archaeon]